MKKIVACLYLDNQDEAGYPLEHVIRSVDFADELVLVASDEENAGFLEAFGRPIITSARIQNSSDISLAMNAAFNAAFIAHRDADAVVLVQADTLSTPDVGVYIRRLVTMMDPTHARWLTAADSQLYMHFQSGWGYSIVGREWQGRFHADGLSHTAAFASQKDTPGITPPSCLHVGYLSSMLARRHRRLAARIWNVPEHIPLIDSMSQEEFIYWHLDHVNQYGAPLRDIEQVDYRFSRVIDEMDLREDQKLVHGVLERWKAAHP